MYRKPSGISGLCIENQWYYWTMYRKHSGIFGLCIENLVVFQDYV